MIYLPLLLLGALFVAASAFTIPNEAERHQVIIVGAGASGFAAAAALLEHNVTDVLLLEASDRIGGRVNTIEFGGMLMEKGAEFIHGQNNEMYELLKPHDLLSSGMPLLEKNRFLFINRSGHTFDSSNVGLLIEETLSIMDETGVAHFNGSVGDYFYPRLDEYLRSKNIDQELGEAIRHLVPLIELAEEAADSLYDVGAWGYTDITQPEGDYSLTWKNGTVGYKILFDILSKKFPNPAEELPVLNKTLFGKQVTRVELGDGQVSLQCADGSTYLADHVIITVSLGVLKKHAAEMFQPPLPEEKTKAIETLGFGCLSKIILLFPKRWWPTDKSTIVALYNEKELERINSTSPYASWVPYITGFFPVVKNDRMLCAWLSGQACKKLDSFTDEQVINGTMELLRNSLGDKFDIPDPEAMMRGEWATYPYTLGAYSYRSVESDRLNITNDDLAQPILHGNKPVLLFAGEATNYVVSSTVHGALQSGRREARRLLQYFDHQNRG